jgi:hypothetical protein
MGFQDEKRCEKCGKSEEYVRLEKHHVRTRSRGGKKIIYLCSVCHRWVHQNIAMAKELGLYEDNYTIDK